MKNIIWLVLIALALVSFTSCNQGDYAANDKSNSNAAAKPEKDMKAAAKDLETKAYEAWQKKDGKFFEGFLTEGFVGMGGSGRTGRETTSELISKNPCDVKSFSISDEDAMELKEGVVLYTGKANTDVDCDGKKSPSPLWAATVYVKEGEEWKAAYHQTAPTTDTKGERPDPPADAPKPKPMEDANKDVTAKVSEKEKGLWESWIKKDTKAFEEALADKFVEIGQGKRWNRADTIKEIGGHECEVKSHELSDFVSSKVSDDIYVLTYKATADGKCGDREMPKGMWVTTIMSKDGDNWKGHFHMTTPAA